MYDYYESYYEIPEEELKTDFHFALDKIIDAEVEKRLEERIEDINHLRERQKQYDEKISEANNKVIIVKYDFERKVRIAQSEILSLNHCNDMSYVPDLGLIAVVNHGPNKKTVTYIDPETLTVVYTKNISLAIYALDYNHERDMYVTGLSNSLNLRRWDSNFTYDPTIKTIYSTTRSDGYTSQGICSDENFIYCVLWDSKGYGTAKFQNIITVYDWYGNFVGLINIDVGKLEPENVFVRNGAIYVTAHSAGSKIFKLKVTNTTE